MTACDYLDRHPMLACFLILVLSAFVTYTLRALVEALADGVKSVLRLDADLRAQACKEDEFEVEFEEEEGEDEEEGEEEEDEDEEEELRQHMREFVAMKESSPAAPYGVVVEPGGQLTFGEQTRTAPAQDQEKSKDDV